MKLVNARKRAPLVLAAVLSLAVTPLFAFNESSGGQAVVGTGNTNTTYYAPAFAYGKQGCDRYDNNNNYITADCVYLYVQGDDDLSDSSYLDQVLMFWNPNTWTGLTSRFAGSVRLLPGTDYQSNAMAHDHYYGQPSVFGYNGSYYMTAFESPDASNFKKQWWGVSSDGQSWTWYPLFQYTGTSNLNIPGVTLQPVTIGTQTYFYGFMEVSSDGGIGTGAIRLRANSSATRGYDLVEMYGPSGWTTIVDPSTNPSGTFSNVVPSILVNGYSNPRYLENGELWTTVLNGAKTCTSSCPTSGGTTTGWADRFNERSVTVSSTLSSAPSFGTASALTSSVRCMPADYENSRTYPMPLTTGSPRLLYSSTNDAGWAGTGHCGDTTNANTFPGMYIVVTGFN